jgi:hypothetical protein
LRQALPVKPPVLVEFDHQAAGDQIRNLRLQRQIELLNPVCSQQIDLGLEKADTSHDQHSFIARSILERRHFHGDVFRLSAK